MTEDACGQGHPRAALHTSDEGTSYCRWCADIAAERAACAEVARNLGAEADWEIPKDVAEEIAERIEARGKP